MIREFFKKQESFDQWKKDNDKGYIFNDFGGGNPEDQKLHLVDCPFVTRMNANVNKICSDNLDDLRNYLEKHRGPLGEGYTACKVCNPF